MKLALILAAVTAAWLLPIAVRGAVRRWKKAQATFDILVAPKHEPIVDLDLAFDEAEHVKALAPAVEFVPDGFTCLGCGVNPALPFKVWCAVCTPVSVFTPLASEPIERGQR